MMAQVTVASVSPFWGRSNGTVEVTTHFSVKKNDILLLVGRNYKSTVRNCTWDTTSTRKKPHIRNTRQHIPFLLFQYQIPESNKTFTVPLISMNFTTWQTKGKSAHMYAYSIKSITNAQYAIIEYSHMWGLVYPMTSVPHKCVR